jgi:hypothetical protein
MAWSGFKKRGEFDIQEEFGASENQQERPSMRTEIQSQGLPETAIQRYTSGERPIYTMSAQSQEGFGIISSLDAISELETMRDIEARNERAQGLLTTLCKKGERYCEAAAKLAQWMEAHGWRPNPNDWRMNAISAGRKSWNEKESLILKIRALYPLAAEVLADPHTVFIKHPEPMEGVALTLPGRDMLRSVLRYCELGKNKGLSYIQLAQRLNMALRHRLSNPGRGISSDLYFSKGDFNRAYTNLNSENKP